MTTTRDAALDTLAKAIREHAALGTDSAVEIARAVDGLIAAHGDVAGWWRGYRDTVSAYQRAGVPDVPPPVAGENVGARTAAPLGEFESGPALYVREERETGGWWRGWTNIADAINAPDDHWGPVRHYVPFGEVRRARQEGHDGALQAEPNEQARLVVAHHNEVAALKRDLSDLRAKLAHDVEEIDTVKRERDRALAGRARAIEGNVRNAREEIADRLEYVAGTREAGAESDRSCAGMHRVVAEALRYEARRLRDPQTDDGEPAPRSPPSPSGDFGWVDDLCAKGHDWASTRLSDGREWQWCKRCQKCPEYVLSALRRVLGARDGEAVPDAAERVIKERNAAREALGKDCGPCDDAKVLLGSREGETLPDAARRVVRERDEWRVAATHETREAIGARDGESTPDAARRAVAELKARTTERDAARSQRDEAQRELKELRRRVHELLARLPGGQGAVTAPGGQRWGVWCTPLRGDDVAQWLGGVPGMAVGSVMTEEEARAQATRLAAADFLWRYEARPLP
ncbi:MAG: hypothetical protein ACHQQR_08790 [Gemmatimonadales bacterium]